jgi:hypothetical protein
LRIIDTLPSVSYDDDPVANSDRTLS